MPNVMGIYMLSLADYEILSMWESGLIRLIRNQVPPGLAGSNPVIDDFLVFSKV